MKLIATFLILSACCFAQDAKSGEIGTVGGFLDVCGKSPTVVSKGQLDVLKSVPSGEYMHALDKALDDNMADRIACFAYLNGLIDGWQVGHGHGVLAMEFPAEVPDRLHLGDALKTLSAKELEAGSAAMTNGVICLPDHVTNGETLDAVLKYSRNYVRDNQLLTLVPTSHIFAEALRDAFPCPAPKPSAKK